MEKDYKKDDEVNRCKLAVRDFLSYYGMYYGNSSQVDLFRNFLSEMEKGLAGEKSSLEMIPTYLKDGRSIEARKPVIVIDIGGTNVRIATICFNAEGQPEIGDYRTYPTPGTKEEITSEEFFREIARFLRPVIDKSSLIGCCFSFATAPQADKDATVIAVGKQLKVKGLIGQKVAENLKRALTAENLANSQRIVVLNDSVAAMLGGETVHRDRKFSGHVGFIFGTGTNVCYVERNQNIKKITNADPSGSMIINVESCGYNGFPRGVIDREFDETLIDFGKDQYEKMVSGKYQGGLVLKVIQKAMGDGLFTGAFSENFRPITALSAREIDDFLNYPFGNNRLAQCCPAEPEAAKDDRRTLYYLIDALNERSALLCSVVLGAVIRKGNIGSNPCLPVYVTAEGSTFYRSKNFREKLNCYIKIFLNDELGLYPEFFRVEDVTLVGTGIAGLTN
jgi:hexokinase